MTSNKRSHRLELTPEQRRKIAGVAAYYGMPQDYAIGVLAAVAADREAMGDKEIKTILEKAGAEYQQKRISKRRAPNTVRTKKHAVATGG